LVFLGHVKVEDIRTNLRAGMRTEFDQVAQSYSIVTLRVAVT